MEKKTFKIIKNMLIPIKSTIEIGPEGILNKGKLVGWTDIVDFSYHVESINRAMNYSIVYDDKNGKGHMLNFIVTIVGGKKKKAMFAEIYGMFNEGITEHFIIPKSQEYFEEVQADKEIELCGSKLSNKGIEITIGMMKKEKVFIPKEEIELRFIPGGIKVMSTENKKHFQHFIFQGSESRYLFGVLEKMFPYQLDD